MLVDYHFHPNLSKHDAAAKRKCALIWERFAQTRLDVVVITEHVFKNPRRAYELLCDTRPATARTIIFPGMEALTAEGIDFIVFAETESIYDLPELMIPKRLGYSAMIDYIKSKPTIYASVAHPCNFGHSGIETRVGTANTIAAIRQLGGVEVSNSCFKGSKLFFERTGLEKMFPKKYLKMNQVNHLPTTYYNFPEVTLYTGGSDAHVLIEIGSGLRVADPVQRDRASVFQAISHNTSTDFYESTVEFKVRLIVNKMYTVISEAFIKALRLYEGRIYQNDDQFTNYYSEAEKETVLAIHQSRVIILKPVLNFLTYFGLTANRLTLISIGCIVLSAATIRWEVELAVGLFLSYMILSGIAAPLARYQNTESEAGAITKIVVHEFALAAAVLTAAALDWASGLWSAVYLLFYTVMLWLVIALNKAGQPIRLVIRSKNIILATLFLYIASHINIIDVVLVVFSVYMAVTSVYMFFRLRRTLESDDSHELISKKSSLQSRM